MCGKEVKIYHKERLTHKHIFCSNECYAEFRKSQTQLNCICDNCGKKFHKKPNHIKKSKNNYCSKECFYNSKHETMKGKNNHQYGLKGKANPTWKSDEKISYYGYRLIRQLDHPFANCDGFVFEHRLIAEKYLLTEENSIEINGKKYLHPDYVVHHIDFNRLNNNVDNLLIMKREEHSQMHGLLKNEEELKKYCEKYNIEYINTLKYNTEHGNGGYL